MLFSYPDKLLGEHILGAALFLPLTWIKLREQKQQTAAAPAKNKDRNSLVALAVRIGRLYFAWAISRANS